MHIFDITMPQKNVIPLEIEEQEQGDSLSVVLKPEILDLSRLEKGCGKAFWRPESLDQYQGQTNIKEILNGYISGCKQYSKVFPHFLISGRAGGGKTALAYILAKQLRVPFVETVANTIKSPNQFIDLLIKANGGIVYLDELQVINKTIANWTLPLLEDFQINGSPIKPFTLFGATTELGTLIKKYKPLIDRFKLNVCLAPYSIDELSVLIKQYAQKNFPTFKTVDENYKEIAKNSRSTPRTGIRLLESFIYMDKPLTEIFQAYNIIYNGFVSDDIKVLKLLAENPKGVGLNSIASYLQTSQENFLFTNEAYMIEQGLITIGSRRQITIKGLELLKELE